MNYSFPLVCLTKCVISDNFLYRKCSFFKESEVGIYKRKQESKNTRRKERKQELDQENDQE